MTIPRRQRREWVASILLLIAGTSASGQEGRSCPIRPRGPGGPATMQRFQTESASWTVTTQSPAGPRFVTEVETTPEMRRIVLSIEVRGRRTEYARVIQRDGIWYVTQPGKAGKYRPYEAPIDFLTGYFDLTRADLFVVVAENTAGLRDYTGTKAGVATYRTPLPEPTRRQLQTTIADYEAAALRQARQPRAGQSHGHDEGPARAGHRDPSRYRQRVDPPVWTTSGRAGSPISAGATASTRRISRLMAGTGRTTPTTRRPAISATWS